MDFGALFKQAGKVAADNSPAILTALGVSGTLTTAYLAAKAAFKSVDVLKEAEEEKKSRESLDEILDEETKSKVSEDDIVLTPQEKFEAVWQLYIPAAASAALTIAAIILAARVQERRNAALAAAYTTVEKGFSEYRAKNLEKLGKKKEQELRDEIAQQRVRQNPPSQSTIIMSKRGGTLCYDMWTDRWFYSDMETIRRAVNDFNAKVINESYASLTEFYHMIDIPGTRESDYIGWSTDKLLELDFSGIINEAGDPGLAFDFKVKPDSRYATAY